MHLIRLAPANVFKYLCLILLMFFVCPQGGVRAAEFQSIGPIAQSMGGAGVACPQGAYSVYFNPALLVEHAHNVEIAVSAGAAYRERNLADAINTLSDIDIEDTFDEFEAYATSATPIPAYLQQNISEIQKELTILSRKNGAQVMPTVSFGVQSGSIGVGIFSVSDASAYAVVDKNHLSFIDNYNGYYFAYEPDTGQYRLSNQAEYETNSIEYAIDNNLTYLQLTGLSYTEIPVGYAKGFDTEYGNFDLGVSMKVMPGDTYNMSINVDTETDDLNDEFKDAEKRSVSWGIDLGAAYKPPETQNTIIGLVIKNINTPKFDKRSGGSLKVKPQARTGVAYNCLDNMLTIAADVDLTSNDTYLSGVKSQFIGGGVNIHPISWASFRFGLMKNIKESQEGTILTAGIGLGMKWLRFDLSGQYSTKKGEYDGHDIPRYARAELTLISKWN